MFYEVLGIVLTAVMLVPLGAGVLVALANLFDHIERGRRPRR